MNSAIAAPMKIETWPISRLVEYARNPRRNDMAVDRMCESIRKFGFKIPVLARSSGEVVDGHLRLKAARKLGIAEVPVILCDEWSDALLGSPKLSSEKTQRLRRDYGKRLKSGPPTSTALKPCVPR